MVLNALSGAAACPAEKRGEPAGQREKLLIFRVSSGNVSGKSPEIDDKEQYRIDDAREVNKDSDSRKCKKCVGDPVKHNENDHNNTEKTGELICPVSSLHEYGKTIAKIFEHS
jgi:hypothetical protein